MIAIAVTGLVVVVVGRVDVPAAFPWPGLGLHAGLGVVFKLNYGWTFGIIIGRVPRKCASECVCISLQRTFVKLLEHSRMMQQCTVTMEIS